MSGKYQPATQPTVQQATVSVRDQRWSDYHSEERVKNDAPLSVCRIRVPSSFFPANSVGDRISLPPKQAAFYARKGVVILETAEVKPTEVKRAGGIEAYLEANPKADLLSATARKKLPAIPGVPDKDAPDPWDFE